MFLSLISSPLYITLCIDKEIKINEEVKSDLNVYEDLDFNGIKDIEQREFTLDPEIQKYKENQYNVFFDDIKESLLITLLLFTLIEMLDKFEILVCNML
ncbi:hypothetical protein [Mycoplasmopsis felis]|nr:hypothetical protein [Mycoplasmopsis felis]MCU9934221.1 hypothetical protein [Mycoplasmopsis felis]MCU9938622.1 hypothetical protein [Mycoplasmopsis felis]WAM01055.1 hypothetical protein NWE60_06815 [Mycoplasmopsis felis]WQQ07081.1 hypothetical protein RRG37_00375 [Mycoplasmopsis felis]WQQ08878.1 hypothetical protein RRG61_02060 [Mycoplasmopsis felis]